LPEAEALCKKEQRNMVLFFQADWCRFCHNMLANGFPSEPNKTTLNQSYYFIPFDIESTEEFRFRGQLYQSTPNKRHEFFNKISGKENVSIPYLVILNPSNEIIFEYEGFLNPEELNVILVKTK
jgi:thioredoxin-related protein